MSYEKTTKHHQHSTTYEHCFDVAYYAVKYGITHNYGNIENLVKAALLHDYYLYNWHNKEEKWHKPHAFKHPKIAADNAKRDFSINDEIYSAIKTHMWPLTLQIPASALGWIITYADKKATFMEFFNIKI